MATVTHALATLSTALGPCTLSVTYDDVTLALDSFHMSTPVEAIVQLRRGNGATWWDVRVPAGEHTQRAGGPVRNLADVAEIRVGAVHG